MNYLCHSSGILVISNLTNGNSEYWANYNGNSEIVPFENG